MNRELAAYVEAEIPVLNKYPSWLRPVMLRRIRRYQPSYDAVYMLRYCFMFSKKGSFLQRCLCREYKRLLVHRYGVYISAGANSSIGKGLSLPHPSSIIIGAGVTIGENCIIYQNVTIGGTRRGEAAENKYPSIGNDCILYAGCKVLGDISVADGTAVGANAVLLKSTEPGSTYAGVPARKIK